MSRYKIKLEVLTPTTIGIGAENDWLNGMDYVVKDNTLYHLDMRRMVSAGIDVNRLSSLILKEGLTTEDIKMLIPYSKLDTISDFQIPVKSAVGNIKSVKPCLRNQLSGNALLAGSSLKGAISSILFALWKEKGQTDLAQVFGNSAKGENFMRFIRIGDFEFGKSSTEIVNTKVFNLRKGNNADWIGGWKQANNRNNPNSNNVHELNPTQFNTIYECLGIKSIAEGIITFDEKQFELALKNNITIPNSSNKKELFYGTQIEGSNAWEKLCYVINEHTLDYLEKEIAFIEQYAKNENAQDSEKIIDTINGVWDSANDATDSGTSCVLRMAMGSGFHSITGDWQFDDYTNEELGMGRGPRHNGNLPKSRKIAIRNGQFLPMGFVKLSLVEE